MYFTTLEDKIKCGHFNKCRKGIGQNFKFFSEENENLQLINNIHRKAINLHGLDICKAFLDIAQKAHMAKNKVDKANVT